MGCILIISKSLICKRLAKGIKYLESLWPSHPGKKITFFLCKSVSNISIDWELEDVKTCLEEILLSFFRKGFWCISLIGLDAMRVLNKPFLNKFIFSFDFLIYKF
jgi:hypothetical protein